MKNISTTEQTSLLKPLLKKGSENLNIRDLTKETTTLNLNEQKEPGYYEVEFDAS